MVKINSNNDNMSDQPDFSHALSLETIKKHCEQKAEFLFMRDLFDRHLPIGNDRTAIEEIFNRLEEAICNKETILNDEFDDGPAIDAGIEPDYKYYSPALLKEHAGRLESKRVPSLLGPGPDAGRSEQAVPDSDSKFESLSPVSECDDECLDALQDAIGDLRDD